MLEAIRSRMDLTAARMERVPQEAAWTAVWRRVDELRQAYPDPEDDTDAEPGDPLPELAVIAELSADAGRLDDTWDRLAGEGALLRLADRLEYSIGTSRSYNQAVAELQNMRDFIQRTYQSIPLVRLLATLRQIAVLIPAQ